METYWVLLGGACFPDGSDTTVNVAWDAPARRQWDESKQIRLISDFEYGAFVEIYRDGKWIEGTLRAPPVRVEVEIKAMVVFETFEDVSQGVPHELARTKFPFGLEGVKIQKIVKCEVAKPRKA